MDNFLTCLISAVTCIWQGLSTTGGICLLPDSSLIRNWGQTATVPAYAVECTPKHVRGAWSWYTAVGIMFGFVSALAFYYVPHKSFGTG